MVIAPCACPGSMANASPATNAIANKARAVLRMRTSPVEYFPQCNITPHAKSTHDSLRSPHRGGRSSAESERPQLRRSPEGQRRRALVFQTRRRRFGRQGPADKSEARADIESYGP